MSRYCGKHPNCGCQEMCTNGTCHTPLVPAELSCEQSGNTGRFKTTRKIKDYEVKATRLIPRGGIARPGCVAIVVTVKKSVKENGITSGKKGKKIESYIEVPVSVTEQEFLEIAELLRERIRIHKNV